MYRYWYNRILKEWYNERNDRVHNVGKVGKSLKTCNIYKFYKSSILFETN